MVINLYNPCKKLQKRKFEESGDKVPWCGNSHSNLQGSKLNTDFSGKIIEKLKEFFVKN